MTLTFSDFEISDLSELDITHVQQTLDNLTSQLQEKYPQIDLKRGVFRDIVLYFHAVLETALRENLQRYQDSRSLKTISENPELATDGVVDEILSNWGVTRKIGTKARGSVVIELSSKRSVTIPAGTIFEASGFSYQAMQTYTARTNASQVSRDTDRLLQALSNGNYSFVIEVEATTIGSDQKLNAGDLLLPNTSIASYATSYALSSFEDGTNTETTEDLLDALQLGIAAKTISNRTNMRAYLRSLEQFSSVTNQSIVGYGDPEMLRDKHNIFMLSTGGRIDWYIRGQQNLKKTTVEIEATLISKDVAADSSVWQFSLTKDVFPGLYEVRNIRAEGTAEPYTGFDIISDSRGLDLTGDEFIPDLVTVAEGAYTAFQTVTIQFTDTVKPLSTLTVGETAVYSVELVGTALIAELQQVMGSRDVRNCSADLLIKAPVPCFVDVTVTISKTAGEAEPDVEAIRAAIVSTVNSSDFTGRLDGSQLIDVIHNYLVGKSSVTALDLFGRIRTPDGEMQYLRDAFSLVPLSQSARMVTANTLQFFAELDRVSVNVQSLIPAAR